jgi:HlyD family secretion protein
MAPRPPSSSKAIEAVPAAGAMPVELLEFQSPSAAIIAMPIPFSSRSAGWIVFLMFAAFVAVATLMPISKVVTGTGRVISSAPELVVQPLETSIVRSIDVHEGEAVHKGQLLAKLDPTFAEADMKTYAAQVSNLSALVDRYRAEISGKPFDYTGDDPNMALQAAIYAQRQAQYKATVQSYDQKIASLRATVDRALSDVAGYRQRLVVANDVEAMRDELQKLNVGSKLNTLAAKDNRLEMLRSLENAANAAASARNDMESAIGERDAFIQQWRADIAEKLSQQTSALSDARENYNKAKLRTQMVELRAERDATVLSIARVSPGSVIQSGQQLFTLEPRDAPLEVEALISGGDSGYVGVGDHVTLKFDTFPYTRYGTAKGTVQVISPNSFTQADATQSANVPNSGVPLPPQQAGIPYYVARISIDKIDLHDVPRGFGVTAGMPVTADISVGKRTIMSYLLNRVLPLAQDAMREPN